MYQTKPSLTDYSGVPINKFYTYTDYTTKPITDLVMAKEFFIKESVIELEDGILGLIDTTE